MRLALALAGALLCLAACGPAGRTYGDGGRASTSAIQDLWFAGDGSWKQCLAATCPTANTGLGADVLTYNSYFGWKPQHESSYLPLLDKVAAAIPQFATPCASTSCHLRSDVPMWDAVALLRAYDGNETSSPGMDKAKAALNAFDRSSAYFGGACPEIAYLEPFGGKSKIKALAAESAYAKAAMLIFHFNNDKSYVDRAERRYLAARKYYFDPKAGLYTAYVIDDGKHCTQVPRRFLAGVNGNMIYTAYLLGTTRGQIYRDQALAEAKTAATKLNDARGIFAGLQDENDTADPLAEVMYAIAYYWAQDFARDWMLRNATAAEGARTASGSIGRFLDGPPPEDGVSSVQTSGGFAITLGAQALQPVDVPSPEPGWKTARFVPLNVAKVPAVIKFTGSGIALRGTLGDPCCPNGARVFIDGVETFDHTGIQQSISPAGLFPNAVLFAWQWPTSGPHEIRLEANSPSDADHAIRLSGYEVK
jgi:hypothetical protein